MDHSAHLEVSQDFKSWRQYERQDKYNHKIFLSEKAWNSFVRKLKLVKSFLDFSRRNLFILAWQDSDNILYFKVFNTHCTILGININSLQRELRVTHTHYTYNKLGKKRKPTKTTDSTLCWNNLIQNHR